MWYMPWNSEIRGSAGLRRGLRGLFVSLLLCRLQAGLSWWKQSVLSKRKHTTRRSRDEIAVMEHEPLASCFSRDFLLQGLH